MVINGYIVEYGVIIEFTHSITYPTKKDKEGNTYELRHLPMIDESWCYSVDANIFSTVGKALVYVKSLNRYQERRRLEHAK